MGVNGLGLIRGRTRYAPRLAGFCVCELSYSFPIYLDSDEIKYSPCPFRFQDKWFNVTRFKEKNQRLIERDESRR